MSSSGGREQLSWGWLLPVLRIGGGMVTQSQAEAVLRVLMEGPKWNIAGRCVHMSEAEKAALKPGHHEFWLFIDLDHEYEPGEVDTCLLSPSVLAQVNLLCPDPTMPWARMIPVDLVVR